VIRLIHKIRAWLRRRTEGSVDPSTIDAGRQDGMSVSGIPYGADAPPGNYVPPVDEGRPRH
jgi:hypothetical protein